jgi:hypothetical protein
MNKELKGLYASKWEEISKKLDDWQEECEEDGLNETENMATHPMLIKTDEEYENTDLRVMIFGKETNNWYGLFEEGIDIDSVISFYDEFYIKNGSVKYGKHFFNFISLIKRKLSDKKIGYIWNNVLKIGKSAVGTPQQGLINYTMECFNIIPNEIAILKPNVLLFLSGPKYDEYIEKVVGKFSVIPVEGFTTNELCIMKFDDLNIDIAIRTYHPQKLCFLGKQRKDEITEIIINLIKNQI